MDENNVQEWAFGIDVNHDGKQDGPEYDELKKALVLDALSLGKKCWKGAITREEYDKYLAKMKQILEKNHESTQAAYSRYAQERKVIFQETEQKVRTGFALVRYPQKFWRNRVTKEAALKEAHAIGWLLGYTHTAGYYAISMKDFEAKLRTDALHTINAREMMSYLDYLLANKMLTKEGLKEKFWSKLDEFMRDWHDRIQSSYHLDKESAWENETAIGTEAYNAFVGMFGQSSENKVEPVLDQIIKDQIGADTIGYAEKIYAMGNKSEWMKRRVKRLLKRWAESKNENEEKIKYEKFLEDAYVLIGRNMGREKFRKKFEESLKNGFSNFDAVIELFDGKGDIAKFRELMRKVSEMDRAKADDIDNQIAEHLSFIWKPELLEADDAKLLKWAKENWDLHLQELLKKAKKHSEGALNADTIGKSKEAAAGAAAIRGRNGKTEEVTEKIQSSVSVEERKELLQSSKFASLIRVMLWNGANLDSVLSDAKAVERMVALLSQKDRNKTEDELFIQLQWLLADLRKQKKDVFQAITNCSDAQMEKLAKSWFDLNSFDLDGAIGSIEKGTSFTDIEKRINGRLKEVGFDEKLSALSEEGDMFDRMRQSVENKGKVSVYIEGEQIAIDKKGHGFEVLIWSRTEYCSSFEQIENFIESRKFIHDIGCDFMLDRVDDVLDSMRKKTIGTWLAFDMKKGFDKNERLAFMRLIAKTLELPIIVDTNNEETSIHVLETYFFTKTTDRSLVSDAMKKNFIVDGVFMVRSFMERVVSAV